MLNFIHHLPRVLLALALALLIALPVFAEDNEDEIIEDEDGLVVVIGEAFYEDETLIVDGYVIVFDVDTLIGDFEEGDVVIVVGVLSEDGTTILAISIEFFEPEDACELLDDPELCEEEGEDDEDIDEEEPIEEEPIEEEEETNYRGYACARGDHPAGLRLASRYNVAYEDVMAMFCSGYGFGEIMLAYELANGDEERLTQIREMREGGMGWGIIRRNARNLTGDEGDAVGITLSTGPRGRPDHAGIGRGQGRGNNDTQVDRPGNQGRGQGRGNNAQMDRPGNQGGGQGRGNAPANPPGRPNNPGGGRGGGG